MARRTATQMAPQADAPARGGVAAIVLAAGFSSRMGEPKLLLRLGDKPILAHVLERLRDSDASEIVVVLGAHADRIRDEVSLEGARVTLNPDYALGMSASIRAGLAAVSAHSEAFLLILGDQPFVSSATFNALIARQEATRARVLVPTYKGVRGNPVLLHRSLSSEVESIAGDVGCRGVVAGHAAEVVEVPVDDPGILLDVDSPEDLQRVRAALDEGTPLDDLVVDRLREGRHGSQPSLRRAATRPRINIDALAQDLAARGESFAVATVVRAVRPTSGKPGDKAIIRENGEIVGFVGGSCTGTSVVTEGLKAIREGEPRLLRLTPEAGFGAPEEGVVEYAMECMSGGILEIYIEPRGPKPTLLVVGPSPIAEALSALGSAMDYQVLVVAPRALPASYPDAAQVVSDLDALEGLVRPGTYAVVATMGKYDEAALRVLAPSKAAYVGLVASRKRASAVSTALRKAGVSEADVGRIHSPAGLDLSAKAASEIALSILAEIVQVRRTTGPAKPRGSDPAAAAPRRSAVDVVCGMEVETDTPLKADHEGTTYYFCSEMCRSRFLESPAAFLA